MTENPAGESTLRRRPYVEELQILDPEAVDALITASTRERRELREQIESVQSGLELAESNLARHGAKLLERQREIRNLQREAEKLREGQATNGLFISEIERVRLPAMNTAISGLQTENQELHYRLASVEAKLRRQGRKLNRRMPNVALPVAQKGHIALIALFLSAIGTGLLIALI